MSLLSWLSTGLLLALLLSLQISLYYYQLFLVYLFHYCLLLVFLVMFGFGFLWLVFLDFCIFRRPRYHLRALQTCLFLFPKLKLNSFGLSSNLMVCLQLYVHQIIDSIGHQWRSLLDMDRIFVRLVGGALHRALPPKPFQSVLRSRHPGYTMKYSTLPKGLGEGFQPTVMTSDRSSKG